VSKRRLFSSLSPPSLIRGRGTGGIKGVRLINNPFRLIRGREASSLFEGGGKV
jgi:hypothetical protein